MNETWEVREVLEEMEVGRAYDAGRLVAEDRHTHLVEDRVDLRLKILLIICFTHQYLSFIKKNY